MTTIVMHGRCVVPGTAAGPALVSREAISGWGGMDFNTGVITERRHPLQGESFAGRVLVFVGAKGSSGWSHYFNLARHAGVAPKAMIFNRMSTKVALGAVVSRVPAITELDADPLDVIETGDWVEVDASHGLVTVTKAAAR
jgi:predicted aconitase with swiveling domain